MTAPMPESLPYGMRDLKVTPYADAIGSVLGSTSYDLPHMQTLTFGETEEYEELRGDDKLVATHGKGAQVEWDLEAGGISLKVWSILTGGQIIESGTTPNRKVIMRKRASDARPYFRIDGQVISDAGGDVVARIYRAKCNAKIEGKFGDGTFFVTAVGGVGLPMLDDNNDYLYDIIQHESKVVLATTPEANPIPVPGNIVVGSITATGATVTWDATVPAATEYTLHFSDDDEVTWETPVTSDTNSKALTGLTADHEYTLQVKAKVGGFYGEYSDSVPFTTAAS